MIAELTTRLVLRQQGLTRAKATGALLLVLFVIVLSCPPVQAAERDEQLWQALRSGGHVALLRHAIAPGTGDPPEFRPGDCATQRNLSRQGRAQAVRIGTQFRDHGIQNARVFSSQWCRCLQTADLLGLGLIEELAFLNSFFNDYAQREPQTAALREWLEQQTLDEPVVLVTHQVNITALTGVYPSSGELVIVRRSADGTLDVVGTIETE